jgi:hypothetical protein
MPKKTYTQINSITLATASSSVVFSSIPQNFRDLVLVIDGKSGTTTDVDIRLEANADTSNATRVFMFGTGTNAGSGTGTVAFFGTLPESTRSNAAFIINIMDYSAADKHKTMLARSNDGGLVVAAHAIRWANTAPITGLVIRVATKSIGTGAKLNLYGIEA